MCKSAEPGTALPTLQLENDRVRVTEWRFPKRGDNTGWHTHEYDYVVVPMFDGELEIHHPDGSKTIAPLTKGVSYTRQAGVEHDVINANDFECAFVEVELLEKAPGSRS